MKVTILGVYAHRVYHMRRDLMNAIIEKGHELSVIGPEPRELVDPILKPKGIRYFPSIVTRSNVNPIQELLALKDIRKLLKGNGTDSLFIYGIKLMPSAVIGAKLAGVNGVFCLVNGTGSLFELSGARGRLIRFMSFPMLRIAFFLADAVFIQNRDNEAMMLKYRLLSKDKIIRVAGSGVNLERYEPCELSEKSVFLMICRITAIKGVNEYVKAAQTVKQKYRDSRFMLVGPKDDADNSVDWPELDKAVANGTIELYGETDNVQEYIKQCRIFVLPSYYEGLPRAVLESMSMGRPIITTDTSGCRETVVNGSNGFLVPMRDAEALAEKMIWMIENQAETARMGQESIRICREKFDVKIVNRIILETMKL